MITHTTPIYLATFLAFLATSAFAQLDFERPPIDYHNRPTSNPIEDLQKKVNSGEIAGIAAPSKIIYFLIKTTFSRGDF